MESGEKEDRIGEHNKNNYEALGEKKKKAIRSKKKRRMKNAKRVSSNCLIV